MTLAPRGALHPGAHRGAAVPVTGAAVTLPPGAHAEDEIRRTVADVLSRPEFRDSQPSILDQALQWLGEQLSRFLALLSGNDVGRAVFALALAAVVVAMIVAAVWFLRRVQRSGERAGNAGVGPTGRSAREWEQDAGDAERAGDLREAVRCRYRAVIADLAARGLLDEVPGWTAGQYREAVRTAVPQAFPQFDRATDIFDRAWYGHIPVRREDVQAMTEAVGEVRGAADRVARGGAAGHAERVGVGT